MFNLEGREKYQDAVMQVNRLSLQDKETPQWQVHNECSCDVQMIFTTFVYHQ